MSRFLFVKKTKQNQKWEDKVEMSPSHMREVCSVQSSVHSHINNNRSESTWISPYALHKPIKLRHNSATSSSASSCFFGHVAKQVCELLFP